MKSPLEGNIKEYTYKEAITLINQYFSKYTSDELKEWADKNDLYYYTLSAIMKGKTSNDLPGNVSKILEKMGMSVKMKKFVVYVIDDSKSKPLSGK